MAERAPAGPLTIPEAGGLTAEQQEVEAAVRRRLQDQLDEFVEAYKTLSGTQGGKYISSDLAKELFEEYQRNRTLMTRAVHNTSSALAEEVYRRLVREQGSNSVADVALVTGPPGAGKTTAFQRLSVESAVKYECNMSDRDRAVSRIQEALANGHAVLIYIVYAKPEVCLRRVIERAQREGRVVDIQYIAETFALLRQTLEYIEQQYNGAVEMIFIENSEDLTSSYENDTRTPTAERTIWKEMFPSYEVKQLEEELRTELRQMIMPENIAWAMDRYHPANNPSGGHL